MLWYNVATLSSFTWESAKFGETLKVSWRRCAEKIRGHRILYHEKAKKLKWTSYFDRLVQLKNWLSWKRFEVEFNWTDN